MKFYLDTEYNSFGGELISIALVPADPGVPPYYSEIKLPTTTAYHPWVRENVLPHLTGEAHSLVVAGKILSNYLRNFSFEGAVVVADWHEDFVHLMRLLLTGPGQCYPSPNLTMQLVLDAEDKVPSTIPHNALADARALRFTFEDDHADDRTRRDDDC